MKIVAFIFDLSKGGAQGVLVNVVNYLHDSGVQVSVVTQNLDDAVYKDDINKEIVIKNLNVSSSKKLLPKLKQYVKENTFDYAMAFSPEIAVNLVLARKMFKKNFKIVGRCINTLSYEYKHANTFFRKYITHNMVKMFYHKVDYAIAQSIGMKQDLIDNFGFKEPQIKVINNAMNSRFEEVSRNITEVYEKENLIIYVGRFEHQKGLKMLLEAFSKMKNKDVSLALIGSGSMKDELLAYSKTLDIINRVNIIDYTRDVMSYYKKAKFTVLSSYFEGFPNVLVESIACGTPVVAYDLPSGPSEIIIEEKNGYLTKYLDIDELSDKMDCALVTNWDAKTVKETAYRYGRESIMKKYLKVFEEGE